MRVLYLLHNPKPELLRYAQSLAGSFGKAKIEVELLDASEWLPTATDPKLNKQSRVEVESKAKGFDLVHAFGYRASWAIGDAAKGKTKWVFSAFDAPRSTHDRLVEKLNFSRAGFCCSDYIKTRLNWAGVDFLKTTPVGIPHREWEKPAPDEATKSLGLSEDKRYILASDEPGTGLNALKSSMAKVQSRTEDVELLLVEPDDPDLLAKLSIAHLFVFPQIGKGVSLQLLDVMQAGVPVLVPEESGLAEYVDDRSTGLWFESYDTLPDMIAASMQMPIRAESMATAAQVRVQEQFGIDAAIERIGRLYHKITDSAVTLG